MRKALLLLMLVAATPAFAQAAPRTLDARYTLSFWASASETGTPNGGMLYL